MTSASPYSAVVLGSSTGGLDALSTILSGLPGDFPVPLIIVQHLFRDSDDRLPRLLDKKCDIQVKQADEKESPLPGIAYFAPPNYHLLLEEDRTFSLSVDERVNYSRPSIDVLFESAAEVYGSELIGVILTGANSDGSRGLKKIKEYGGFALVQDPLTAQAGLMPRSALEIVQVDQVVGLERIGPTLAALCMGRRETFNLGA